jgi:hypothetical protein
MIAAIMQPTYLPWLGYFDLIDQSDIFVFLDSVQFERRSWQQRNQIKTNDRLEWLTVPVLKSGHYDQVIKDVEIMYTDLFPMKHIRTIEHNYRRSANFGKYFPPLTSILEAREPMLSALNQRLILWLAKMFGIRTEFTRSSDMHAKGSRSALLANICRELGATTYLSPLGSAGYIVEEQGIFAQNGITVLFQHYEHPQYRQPSEPFLPFASALDLLFNEGERSLGIIRSGRLVHYSMDEARQLVAIG